MHLALMLFQEQPSPEQAIHALMAMMGFFSIFIVIMLAVVIVPFWFICKKAGFSPWLALLNVVPFGNLILIYVLAFAEWKVPTAPTARQIGYPFPPQ